MKIKYSFNELGNMLRLGVKDLEIRGNSILLTPQVASYYLFMKSK